MYKLFLIASLLFTLSFTSMAAQKFGKGADKSKIVPISKLLASAAEYKDKEVTVSGTIVSVCKNRGCWMKFASDKKYQTLRIKVKHGQMNFPVTLLGKKGLATGTLKGIQLTQDKAREWLGHMAKESGEPFNAEDIKGPQTIYQLVPTGVTVE